MKLKKLLSAAMSAVLFGTSCCMAPASAVTVQEEEELPCTLYAESVTVQPGEKGVGLSVYIKDNPGYSACGIRVYYNEAITPHLSETGHIDYEVGPAADEVVSDVVVNTKKKIIGFGAMTGSGTETDDGLMFTVYFDVDENAKAGSYPLKVEVDKMLDENLNSVSKQVPYQLEREYYSLNVEGDPAAVTTTVVSTTKKAVTTTTATTKVTTTKKTTSTTAKTTTTKTTTTKTTTTATTTPDGAAFTTTLTAPIGTADPVEPSASSAVIYGDQITVQQGDESVAYKVMIRDNPGFSPSGVRITYPEGLEPLTKKDGSIKAEAGDVVQGITVSFAHNSEKRMIGMVSIGQEMATDDGTLFTVYFKVSPDMESKTYPIKVEVTRLADVMGRQIDHAVIDGEISVESGSSPELRYGDVDLDGAVDVGDAVLLARFLAEDREAIVTPDGRRNADVNKNGTEDSNDVILILKYIARLITKF